MNSPKISIVVPVYNVEHYLSKCLDSIVGQTFSNIEIICVNDGSTDNSLDILKAYAEKDKRIVIVDCKENAGLLVARKIGVEKATGEYLIFVDSDDYIDNRLCQFIFDISQKEDADIIQFSSKVDSSSKYKNYDALKNALKPFGKTLINDEILEHSFIKCSFATQVWAKIYKTSLCKKVYNILPYEHCYVGEDVFAMFFLTMFAKKYIGIKTEGYYVYRFGLGISGESKMSLSKFEMYAKMSNWIKFTQNYLEQHSSNNLQMKACERMKERLFKDCCEIMQKRVKDNERTQAGELIYKYWQDISIDDSLWKKCTGYHKTHFEHQSCVEEYIIASERYKDKQAELSFVIYGNKNCNSLKNIVDELKKINKDIEIICINDGAYYDTEEVLKELCESDDRVVAVNQKYIGEVQSKNKGVLISKGKYICFLNVDDKIDIELIYVLIDILKENEPDILLSDKSFNDCIISGNTVLINCLDKNFISDFPVKYFISKKFIAAKNLCFNKKLKNPDELFIISSLLESDKVFITNNDYVISKHKDATTGFDKFIDSFITCNVLNAKVLSDDLNNDMISEILPAYVRLYDISAKKIYRDLSSADKSAIAKKLPGYYLYSFYNFRDIEEIKNSKSYLISQSIIKIADRVLKLFK